MSTQSEQEALPARLRAWVKLTEEKRELEADLRKVQDVLSAMEPLLVEDMALAGMKSASVDGYTCYTAREFTAGIRPDADKSAVFRSWAATGREQFLMLSWSSLRSFVRELQEAGEPLPADLAAVVEVGEQFRLRTRKG